MKTKLARFPNLKTKSSSKWCRVTRHGHGRRILSHHRTLAAAKAAVERAGSGEVDLCKRFLRGWTLRKIRSLLRRST